VRNPESRIAIVNSLVALGRIGMTNLIGALIIMVAVQAWRRARAAGAGGFAARL
jgi:hypothetical protein